MVITVRVGHVRRDGRDVRPRGVVGGVLELDGGDWDPGAAGDAQRSVNREVRVDWSCGDASSRVELRTYRSDFRWSSSSCNACK